MSDSIIWGALGGIGKGLVNMTDTYIKSEEVENAETRRLANERILMAERASITRMESENLERFKQTMADDQRGKMNTEIDAAAEGLIGSEITDPAERKKRLMDPSIRSRAAATAGYVDEGHKLAQIDASGNKGTTVPWGAIHERPDGTRIDNASALKGEIERQKAQATSDRVSRTGTMNPNQKLDFQKKVDDIIDGNYKDDPRRKHPFGISSDDGKPEMDMTRKALVKDIVNAGEVRNPTKDIAEVEGAVEKFNSELVKQAKAESAKVFDKSGKINSAEAEKLSAAGVPTEALTSRDAYARYLRDRSMTADKFAQFYAGQKGQTAPATQSAPQGIVEKQAPAVTAAKPAEQAKPVAQADPLSSQKQWVKDKLMGVFDGPSKYQEIARNHKDPKVRQAAQQLWDEYQSARNQE